MTTIPYGNDQTATDFLDDIIAVYKKHGLALSHEDTQGAFEIVKLDESNIQWLLAAQAEAS